jgi:hypothetical protein
MTTAQNRSGRSSAAVHATGLPQSCPTMAASFAPSASRSPTTSPTVCSCEYACGSAGASVPP